MTAATPPRHRADRRPVPRRAARLLGQAGLVGCTVAALALGASQARATGADAAGAPSPGDAARVVVPGVARLITGVVTDTAGRPIDDVLVRAVDARGVTRASALTYASAFASGPQHGFFFLEVPPGAYTVRITHLGHLPTRLSDVVVAAGADTRLGAVEMRRRPAVSRTTLAAARTTVPVGSPVRLRAEVLVVRRAAGVPGTPVPRGWVQVTEGRRVLATVRLRPGAGTSRVDVVIRDLRSGRHALVARYAGSESVAASVSRPLVVRVPRGR